ncbi:MAG: glycosyltransferase [Bacteroidia bacterium]|nr:glycosyltransferase [Bacteroidia bacterium]
MNDLISIIIPVYNRQTIIVETLDSILSQSYKNWECLLVDDGSADNTLKTLKSFAENDTRFKLFERPQHLTKGANACRNYGFSQAKGQYINWFDSDDLMEPDFLKQKVNAFTKTTNAVLHKNKYANYTLTRFRDSKFKYSSPDNLFYHYAMDEIEIQTSCLMWKQSYLRGKDLFNESMQRYQDNEFHIRMLARKPDIIVLDSVLATIRGGDGDSSQISAKQNLTKEKLYDIFFYRYQCLLLNRKNNYKQEQVNRIVSKKTLWTFYETLAFEKKLLKRFKILKQNYGKLKLAYSSKGFTFIDKLNSHLYLAYLLAIGTKRKK